MLGRAISDYTSGRPAYFIQLHEKGGLITYESPPLRLPPYVQLAQRLDGGDPSGLERWFTMNVLGGYFSSLLTAQVGRRGTG